MADTPEQARVRAMLRARGEQLAPRAGAVKNEYIYVQARGTGSSSGSTPASGASRAGQIKDWANRIQKAPVVRTPNRVPSFLGTRPILFGAWGVAMLALSADDWFNNKILPRPSRLWWGTLLYGMLALLSISDGMVPLANALGVGYAIVILWDLLGGKFGNEL